MEADLLVFVRLTGLFWRRTPARPGGKFMKKIAVLGLGKVGALAARLLHAS